MRNHDPFSLSDHCSHPFLPAAAPSPNNCLHLVGSSLAFLTGSSNLLLSNVGAGCQGWATVPVRTRREVGVKSLACPFSTNKYISCPQKNTPCMSSINTVNLIPPLMDIMSTVHFKYSEIKVQYGQCLLWFAADLLLKGTDPFALRCRQSCNGEQSQQ